MNAFSNFFLSIKFLWTVFFTFALSTFSIAQTTFGDIQSIDQELLNTFILKEVNEYRKKVKANAVVNNSALSGAAQDHANYMQRRRRITHYQRKRIKKTPKNRVDFYGAKFESVGENVQVNNLNLGADLNEKKHPRITTYEALAEELVLAWKNSPPHYANMINPNHKTTYTSISITESGEVYACQLFGSSMYVDKYAEYRDSVEYKPYKKGRCWRCRIRPPAGGVEVREDSTIVFVHYPKTFMGLPKPELKRSRMRFFNPWRDGLAADIIVKSQYPCDSNSYFNGVSNVRGFSLPPVYKKDFGGVGLYQTEIVLGKVPAFINEEFEVNLIVVQNKRPCSNTMFSILPSDFHVDIPLDYDFDPSNKLLSSYRTNTVSRSFFFDKAKITPNDSSFLTLLSDLKYIPGSIDSVEISGFSSIEGSTELNVELYQKRAEFLKGELLKAGVDSSLIQISSSENFGDFRRDVVGTKYDSLAGLSNVELKSKLSDRSFSDSLEFILRNHRYVKLQVHTRQKYENEYDITTANGDLEFAIYQEDVKEAIEVQRIQYRLILDGLASIDQVKSVNIPREKKYAKLLHNVALMELQSDSVNLESLMNFRSDLVDILSIAERQKQIHTSLAIVDYHLYTLGLDNTKKNNIYDSISKRKFVDRTQRSRILLNLASQHDWLRWFGVNTYERRKYLFKNAKRYVKSAKMDAGDIFEVASYYSFFDENKYAYGLTKTKIDDTENPHDLIYFLKLIHLMDVKLSRNKYLGYFKKIRKYGGEDFCSFFNNPALNFQILDDEEIKEIYCSECADK